MATGEQPTINDNSALQRYYATLESRVGYRLVLGGTRHFGWYPADTYWPFPISKALRAMEDRLYERLDLPQGRYVLDAGCGVGHVAIRMAQKGLRVYAIDVVERHLSRAQRNVNGRHVGSSVSVNRMDYHNLNTIEDGTFDGVYTMETLVHSTDTERVIQEFYRVMKPGGRIVLHEYDHVDTTSAPKYLARSMARINYYAAMPTNARFERGVLEEMLVEAGFQDVQVVDMSANIKPMLRLFYVLALIPYLIISLVGLEAWFINTVAAYNAYKGYDLWRYVSFSATKPSR